MPSFWNVGAIFFGLLAGLSQANLLGDTHMLKRYPQAVEVPSAATHFPSTILPGNGSAVGTSTRVLLPTSTRQLIYATTLHSLHSRESTGVSTGTGTDGNVGDGASEPPVIQLGASLSCRPTAAALLLLLLKSTGPGYFLSLHQLPNLSAKLHTSQLEKTQLPLSHPLAPRLILIPLSTTVAVGPLNQVLQIFHFIQHQ
ncbi:hypothetical protein FOCG_07840 [Fusarium oxysporum f. sp. radicis-lycopersici 26381]|uniref:Uncharacterized protein n=1 Tax=Fusarium oxysporum Fo47 TaxID=660027 RepID=W9JM29_FUSOX|nr:uncharacterized protein FOBCDRAFT_208566 [Fusarium oxysporum Fo47]EWZ85098.1 hypothetical protein FOWG_11608 [Fusarium oxysporum f. sp. lycopersici MN25]EXL52024.1 hypothetical protein FOCG_07840 [Fusarium oxysporum f. sp. radicis-lycopersici 26381]RKL51678.1 hypothetical protein BFJ70_g395 [Fusarium oxysporum]EWZ30700.1 hypothetical protein FOZG_15132 [Fusarium oxysporum Fo47]QKD61892.1 hypothetical protein FOBCDRAFT_208566 [Fusarium oxysporum Fo47]